MPETSEGHAPTGLAPNSAVSRTELDPADFDQQTAEIFLARLNRVLGLPETTNLTDALDQLRGIVTQRDVAVAALRQAWAYFHQRFQGLKCGLAGTWEQACNEVTQHIRNLESKVFFLEEQAGELRAALEKEGPRLAQRDGPLPDTDRAALIELVPGLLKRIDRLERKVESLQNTPGEG